MKLYSSISIMVIVISLANTLSSCIQTSKNNKEPTVKIDSIHQIADTSKTAIISLNSNYSYPFDSTYKAADLTQDDVNYIERLLIESVASYDSSFGKRSESLCINLNKRNYRKQLIAVTNKNNEKIVWVNCFCSTWNSNNWKTEILLVEDGGNCYFSFKINLYTKKYYDFAVNGLA